MALPSFVSRGIRMLIKAGVAGAALQVGGALLLNNQLSRVTEDTAGQGFEGGDFGPLSALNDTPFDFTVLNYPRDLVAGNPQHDRFRYHIEFAINVAENSQYFSTFFPGIISGNPSADSSGPNPIPPPPPPSNEAAQVPATGMGKLVRRKVKRTSQVIRLYMPDTLNWGFNQEWFDASSTSQLGTVGKLASVIEAMPALKTTQAKIEDFIKNPSINAAKSAADLKAVSTAIQELGATLSNKFLGTNLDDDYVANYLGKPFNPNLEMLYRGAHLRNFSFEFIFAPRNRKDAIEALRIIKAFKFHAAPELDENSQQGRYFIPPSDFEISFFDGKNRMRSLGLIGRCVLTNVNVDFAASGQFSAISNPTEDHEEGGLPTHIRMILEFKELDIVTKKKVLQGY